MSHQRQQLTSSALLALLLPLASLACQAAGQAGDPTVVAHVDGRPILADEIDRRLAADLAQIESQMYLARRRELERVIDERLLAAEADRREMAVGQLLETQPPAERQRFIADLRSAAGVTLSLPLPPPYRLEVPIDDAAPSRGPVDAPVTIVEFTDFHCPYCRAVQDTLRELDALYDGRIRWVHRDIPIDGLHPRARQVHLAARCAADQGRFWAFRDRVFETYPAPLGALSDLAVEVGLDATRFELCRSDPATAAALDRDVELATTLGIASTPTFFINGRQIIGAQPLAYFVDFIEAALASRPSSGR